jgi:hypothetical protein
MLPASGAGQHPTGRPCALEGSNRLSASSPRCTNRRIDTLNARQSKGGDEPRGRELPHGLHRILIGENNT